MLAINYEDYNLVEIEDAEYGKMVDGYLDGIEAYDPQVGTKFRVVDLKKIGKGLTALIQNNIKIKLSFTEDYLYITDVLLKDIKFSNRREALSYIDNNQEDVQTRLDNIVTNVEITEVLNGNITGSISSWNKNNLEEQFKFQLELNKELELKRNKNNDSLLEQLRYYKCRITERNDGGYLGYIDGVQVFIPGSMAHNKKIEDYDSLLNTTIDVMIENYAYDRDIYVVSFKRYIQYLIPEMVENLDRNEQIIGVVTGVKDYGIFINFKDYLNGMLHTSEMTPSTLIKFEDGGFVNGEEIKFYIKSYKKPKIILTEKSQKEIEDFWDDLIERFEGKILPLKVTKRVSTGYLFELPDENKTKGLLYDIEAEKFGFKIKLDETYDVLIDSMDITAGKIFLKYPFKT